MKIIYTIATILLVGFKVYSCSKIFQPPIYLDTISYALFMGKVISINNTPCDTVDDTLTIRNVDKFNADSLYIKKFKRRLILAKLNGEEKIIINDSQTVLRKINCIPSEIVVVPTNIFTLPYNIDTISVYRYGLAGDCSNPPIRLLDKKLLHDNVLIGGHLNRNSKRIKRQTIHVNSFNCTDFFISYPAQYMYNFIKVVNYKSTDENNLCFEVSKDLIRLYRENNLEKRIEIMKNLKNSKYYLDDRDAFRKLFSKYFGNYSEELQEKIFRKIHD